MKKTLFFGLIAASLGFTACSSEDDAILGEKTQKKGMVLNATVEQPAETRATIDNSAADWQFAFAENDEISVTNSAVSGTYYTFTNDGTDFKSADAETTATAADWYAFFPSNTIDLTNQAGTMEGVANLYALAGTTASATTGESGLDITMSAKVAILKIENYKGSAIDIQVKTSATDYVTGLTAKSGVADFNVETSTTPTTLFTTSTTGDYYVAVPAGVQLSVKDGSTTIKSTGTNGLTAGKYYTLTIGKPLTLTALQDDSQVKITFSDFQYKTSTEDWTDYTSGTAIEVNNGQYVQFRAKPGSTVTSVKTSFSMTAGSFAASGNVMSLLSGNEMGERTFYALFRNCAMLKDASQLLLPATTLADKCYYYMFYNCTSLETAPASLPATTLASDCYAYMFQNCSSLTTAPASLPATTLASNCYTYMFYGCTNLTTAPASLPATTLADNCYAYMFQGCSSLETAPASLPATTMASNCYQNMFYNCTSLETAPTLPAITGGADRCLFRMFYGCKKLKSVTVNFTSWPSGTNATATWLYNAGTEATGDKTFRCPTALGTESTITRGNNNCPSGWTVVNL